MKISEMSILRQNRVLRYLLGVNNTEYDDEIIKYSKNYAPLYIKLTAGQRNGQSTHENGRNGNFKVFSPFFTHIKTVIRKSAIKGEIMKVEFSISLK